MDAVEPGGKGAPEGGGVWAAVLKRFKGKENVFPRVSIDRATVEGASMRGRVRGVGVADIFVDISSKDTEIEDASVCGRVKALEIEPGKSKEEEE